MVSGIDVQDQRPMYSDVQTNGYWRSVRSMYSHCLFTSHLLLLHMFCAVSVGGTGQGYMVSRASRWCGGHCWLMVSYVQDVELNLHHAPVMKKRNGHLSRLSFRRLTKKWTAASRPWPQRVVPPYEITYIAGLTPI